MKYIAVLLLGLLLGAVLFVVGLAYNPFVTQWSLSPLDVSNAQTVTLGYSAVASDAIMYTNDGESRIDPHPEKVLQLWEAPIRKTSAMATVLWDARNQPAGLGIKFSSASEDTRLFEGRALTNSVWYVYLPGRGGFFIEQTENYWGYLRDIVVPAYRSSADTWKGTWLGNMTSGPGALGTAKVSGSSGDFLDLEMLGVESLAVQAWRVDTGAVAADGQLLIEFPQQDIESFEEE